MFQVKRRKLNSGEKDAAGTEAKKAAAEKEAVTPQTKTCVHEVALPPGGWTGTKDEQEALINPTFTGVPAKTYPFTLDPFQSTAVACLVRSSLQSTRLGHVFLYWSPTASPRFALHCLYAWLLFAGLYP